MEEQIARARAEVAAADAVLITAGAGIGVDSGLPDFRGDEGFWKAYPPIRKLGLSFAEMANPRWFEKDPRLAWAFYGHRLRLYRETQPHAGFTKLLELADSKEGGGFVFTSNVDGQFQKAGFPEEQIMECHGSIHHLQCSKNCSEAIWPAAGIDIDVDEARFQATGELPHCPRCGALARPNILMFGDWSWQAQRTEAQQMRLEAWLNGVAGKGYRLVVIEVGAGKAVETVRHTSEVIAREFGGRLIRINPRDDAVPEGEIALKSGGLDGIGTIM
jgi:NAD-dependent SIR2 family protein deacetylase